LSSHTFECLQTFTIKIDQLVLQFEDRVASKAEKNQQMAQIAQYGAAVQG